MPGLRGSGCGVLDDLIYGDGSDGDVIISGSLFINRDMFFKSLRVLKGFTLFTNGHKIRVRETLTIDGDSFDVGVVANNGINSRNSNGQSSEISGSSIPPGTFGAPRGTTGGGGVGGAGMYNGGTGVGNTLHPSDSGSALVPAVDTPNSRPFSFGGAGGRGGDSFSGSVAGAGSVASNFYIYRADVGATCSAPAVMGGINNFFTLQTAGTIGFGGIPTVSGNFNTGSFNLIAGGGGGGAGACFNSGTVGIKPRSGWGGGGGGVVFISAREVILNGRIDARGGNGGNTFGKAGGGGGGGGGFIFLAYSTLTTRLQNNQQFFTAGGLPGLGQTLPANPDPRALQFSGTLTLYTTSSLAGSSGSFLLYQV